MSYPPPNLRNNDLWIKSCIFRTSGFICVVRLGSSVKCLILPNGL